MTKKMTKSTKPVADESIRQAIVEPANKGSIKVTMIANANVNNSDGSLTAYSKGNVYMVTKEELNIIAQSCVVGDIKGKVKLSDLLKDRAIRGANTR